MTSFSPTFDLTSIGISNLLGVLLLGVLFCGNIWRLRDRTPENVSLLLLMAFTFSNCLVDPVVYAVDGKPGMWNRIVGYVGNSWLFFAQVSAAICWVQFFCRHLNGNISKRQSKFLNAVWIISAALIFVNVFVPIVFSINDANVYSRRPLFVFFAAANYVLLMDSLLVYFFSRMRGGSLKMFPAWIFAVPVVVGGIVQSCFYGVSVTAVCLAISVAGVLASLQNELMYRDSLTDLYNRRYLDSRLKGYSKKRKANVTGIMVNLNAFKAINDHMGHAVGDKALVAASQIIRGVVSELGVVIRYAGDEFIILVNTQDDRIIASCMSEIRRSLESFNQNSGEPYKLAASMGCCKLDFSAFDVDSFINEIDKRMYEDKKMFYATIEGFDRRSR